MAATLQPRDTIMSAIGQPLRRKEDARLVIGKGLFTDDFSVEGQVYAALVRSPHPHARIVHCEHGAGPFYAWCLGSV